MLLTDYIRLALLYFLFNPFIFQKAVESIDENFGNFCLSSFCVYNLMASWIFLCLYDVMRTEMDFEGSHHSFFFVPFLLFWAYEVKEKYREENAGWHEKHFITYTRTVIPIKNYCIFFIFLKSAFVWKKVIDPRV